MALRVKAVLDADGARFQQAMGRAEGAVRTLAARMAAVFTIGAVANFGRRTVEWASRMTDLAAQTGLAVAEIQRLDRVAIKTGVSLEQLTKAYNKIDYQRINALSDPSGRQAQAFAAFGIGQDALRNMSARDILKQIGSQDLYRLKGELQLLFEAQGPEMIEAFRMYATSSLQNMATVSAETANQLDAVADAMGEFQQDLKIFAATLIGSTYDFMLKVVAGGIGLWRNIRYGEHPNKVADFLLKGLEREREEQRERDRARAGDYTYEPPEIAKSKADKLKLYTDPLLSVGNFLGATGSMVNSIGEKQLLVQKRTLQAVDGINQKMDRYLSQFGGFGL